MVYLIAAFHSRQSINQEDEIMKTYDRNRNAISTGSMVMVADSGATGVIKAIHAEGKTAEQIRRADCVEIDGHEGLFSPLNLIRLGFN